VDRMPASMKLAADRFNEVIEVAPAGGVHIWRG
jgi:hypothetical protein